MSEADFQTTVSGVDQADKLALSERSSRGLRLDLIDVFVFIHDPVVDQLVIGVSAGADAGNVRGGGLKFDPGDLDLGGKKVGEVFATHKGGVNCSQLAADLSADRVCHKNGIEFREPALIPEVGDHLAPVSALDVAQDRGQRVGFFPVGCRLKREVGWWILGNRLLMTGVFGFTSYLSDDAFSSAMRRCAICHSRVSVIMNVAILQIYLSPQVPPPCGLASISPGLVVLVFSLTLAFM